MDVSICGNCSDKRLYLVWIKADDQLFRKHLYILNIIRRNVNQVNLIIHWKLIVIIIFSNKHPTYHSHVLFHTHIFSRAYNFRFTFITRITFFIAVDILFFTMERCEATIKRRWPLGKWYILCMRCLAKLRRRHAIIRRLTTGTDLSNPSHHQPVYQPPFAANLSLPPVSFALPCLPFRRNAPRPRIFCEIWR